MSTKYETVINVCRLITRRVVFANYILSMPTYMIMLYFIATNVIRWSITAFYPSVATALADILAYINQ